MNKKRAKARIRRLQKQIRSETINFDRHFRKNEGRTSVVLNLHSRRIDKFKSELKQLKRVA